MPQYELNIRDYWQIIQRRSFVFLAVLFAVLVFTVIHTNMQKPIYRARASVQFIERRSIGGMLSDLVVLHRGDPLTAQSKIITSLPVLEKVVTELGLVEKNATSTEIMQVAENIRGAVSTSVLSDSSIIIINVTHSDPVMAANIANQTAKAYIAENLREATKESRGLRVFIEKQLEEVGAKLKSSEEALAQFKKVEAPSGVALALENKLVALETTQQDLLKRYTLAHPDIKSIDAQISSLKEQMQVLPQKELEYSRLKREVDIDARLYIELKNKLAGARLSEAEKAENVRLVDIAMPSKFPIRPNKRLNYLTGLIIGLVLGLAATSIVEQLDTSIGTIEDVENYLKLPVLGVIPFSHVEKEKGFMRPSSKQKDKINKMKKRLIIYPSVLSSVIEAYHILDTNIWLSFEKKTPPEVIIVSSAAPGEGKTLISANLAITMAQRGLRVILIDADLRRPVLYRLFNLQREPGLSEILSNTSRLKDALRGFADLFLGLKQDDTHHLKTAGLNNLQFITPGHLPDNPTALLAAKTMTTFIDELAKSFDVLIFDLPPVLPVSDVSLLCPKADAVILVYNVGKTPRSAIQRTKKQLESSGAKLKGVVLNCLNPETEMAKSYYYYSHYQYYGKKEERTDV